MDIITRGSDEITSQAITQGRLRAGEEVWVWRYPRPTQISRGEKVYFVVSKVVYGYAFYKNYEWRQGRNVERQYQEGHAIVVEGPFTWLEPPVTLPDSCLRGSWRWRYIRTECKHLFRNL